MKGRSKTRHFSAPMVIILVLLATTALVGRASTQYVHHRYEPQFLPETADSATLAACRVVLVQDDPFVVAKKTSATEMSYAGFWGQEPCRLRHQGFDDGCHECGPIGGK